MDLTVAILGVVVTLIASIAAVGSWVAARHASRAAVTLTAIERRRWHTELTPRFNVSYTTSGERATLTVALVGPTGLDRLDEMTLSIRDDRPDRDTTTGQPSREEIAAQIWGPYRFVAGVDGADASGRHVPPIPLLPGVRRPFALERTRPPPWAGPDAVAWWGQEYQGTPLRLSMSCHRDGHDRWTVLVDVRENTT